MKRLTIGIDIDGTITDPFYWLDFANEHFKTDIKPEEITVYEIGEVMDVKKEDYMKFYEEYKEEIHGKAGVREGAKEVLWKIFQKHDAHYITARDESLHTLTLEWFKKHQLPDQKLHSLGSHHKAEKAGELGCDLFIEDRYENALELAEAGITVILIDCSYNRMPLKPNMIRVHSWTEVEQVIHEIAQKKTAREPSLKTIKEFG